MKILFWVKFLSAANVHSTKLRVRAEFKQANLENCFGIVYDKTAKLSLLTDLPLIESWGINHKYVLDHSPSHRSQKSSRFISLSHISLIVNSSLHDKNCVHHKSGGVMGCPHEMCRQTNFLAPLVLKINRPRDTMSLH